MFPTNLNKKECFSIVVISLLAAYLILFNLDYAPLWHDEGTNAIMARNFLNTGTFTGWDGRNLFVGLNGGGVNSNLVMAAYPPWPAIPSALGIAVFGHNEIGLRFFHALLGLFSLFFFWRLLKLDFANAPRLRIIAFALFALSAQAILFMRQGRYYPDAFFFSLASFYYYRLYISSGGRWQHLAAAAGLTILNFLNHFAIGASVALAFGCWHLLYYRRQTTKQQWLAFAVFGSATAIICMLYLWLMGIIGGNEQLEYDDDIYTLSWLPRHFTLLFYYLRDTVRYGWLPLWITLWLAFMVLNKPKKTKKNPKPRKKKLSNTDQIANINNQILRWVVLAFLNIITAAVVSVQPSTHSLADSRYLIGALPFLMLISAACVNWLWKQSHGKFYAPILLAALLFSNLPGYPFLAKGVFIQKKIKWPLPSLVWEIHQPYPTATKDVAEYLKKYANQDDVVYVHPWQEQVLLHFYLGDKLIFCCLLDGKDNLPKNTIKALGVPVYREDIKLDKGNSSSISYRRRGNFNILARPCQTR
jgi:4-amino-4-deoxy-L-arabinose transferase-like glycosyltransferase